MKNFIVSFILSFIVFFLASFFVVSIARGQSLSLTWDDNSTNEGGFTLERGDIVAQADATLLCTNFIEIVRLPADSTVYVDSTITAFRFYCYRVAAVSIVTNAEPQEKFSVFSNITHGVSGKGADNLVVQ